jgi:aryl-alcohol dehydrogenase-like predicted oxidoreductase
MRWPSASDSTCTSPSGGQDYYNLLNREVEVDYLRLQRHHGYGLVALSPLAGGYLTGKYLEGKGEETARYNLPFFAGPRKLFFDPIDTPKNRKSLLELRELAAELECSLTQLSIAWVIKYRHLSSVAIGPKNLKQLQECLSSLEVLQKFTPELEERIAKIIDITPTPRTDFKTWKTYPPVRP